MAGCSAPSDAAPRSPSRSPDLTSNLLVEAGQRFVYAGESDSGAYQASVKNVGDVSVTLCRRIGEARQAITTLAPGTSALAKFKRGEAALFENDASRQAQLLVYVWGDTDVGMRYEAINAMEK